MSDDEHELPQGGANSAEDEFVVRSITDLVAQMHSFSGRIMRGVQLQPQVLFVVLVGEEAYVYLDRRSRAVELDSVAALASDMARSAAAEPGEYTQEMRIGADIINLYPPEAHRGKGRKRQICGDTVLRYGLDALHEKRTKHDSDDDPEPEDDGSTNEDGGRSNSSSAAQCDAASESGDSEACMSPLDKLFFPFYAAMLQWAMPESDRTVADAIKKAVQGVHCL
jgi:hypothetical protein